MSDQLRNAFETKAVAWDEYTETPPGRLREELNWRYLVAHLPPADEATQVLDAGAGTGGLGVRLAQRGHRVTLLDLADEMLELARKRAELTGLTDQIECYLGRVEDLPDLFAPETFDAVACHTLVEYVPDPAAAVQTMASRLRPGGIFSLAFVNCYADALRLALSKGQLTAAREALTAGTSPADLFGVPRQTFDSETVRDMLEAVDVDIIGEYGVRIFADYLASDNWKTDPAAFEALVDLEIAAADRFPYRHIGRYGQIIGCRK